jgi:hypothetical protein
VRYSRTPSIIFVAVSVCVRKSSETDSVYFVRAASRSSAGISLSSTRESIWSAYCSIKNSQVLRFHKKQVLRFHKKLTTKSDYTGTKIGRLCHPCARTSRAQGV